MSLHPAVKKAVNMFKNRNNWNKINEICELSSIPFITERTQRIVLFSLIGLSLLLKNGFL